MQLSYVLLVWGLLCAAGGTSARKKSETHEHWEHLVKRAAETPHDSRYPGDETAHIVDIQQYYQEIFEDSWEEDPDYLSPQEQALLDWVEYKVEQGKELTRNEQAYTQELYTRDEAGTGSLIQKRIKGRYIVMLHSKADNNALNNILKTLEQAHSTSNQHIGARHIFPVMHLSKGFVATMSRLTAELLKSHPLVEVVEQDVAVRDTENVIEQTDLPPDQPDNLWNLDRLDQHDNQLDGQYNPEATGKNVVVYVLDTGIRYSHNELEGRAHYPGFDIIDEMTGSNLQGRDCQGHGTFVASTITGKTFGVAKGTAVYSVREFNCKNDTYSTRTMSMSAIIQALDRIVEHHRAIGKPPAVISASIQQNASVLFNNAIRDVSSNGIVFVASSGNFHPEKKRFDDKSQHACDYSPPSARDAISIGATGPNDSALFFSCAGACMDLFAPGQNITGASINCDDCKAMHRGTSASCPHGAAVAAILLEIYPHYTPRQIKEKMIEHSTKGAIDLSAYPRLLAQATPNRLLYIPSKKAKNRDVKQNPDQKWMPIAQFLDWINFSN